MKIKRIIILVIFIMSFNVAYCSENNDNSPRLTEELIMEQLDSIDLREMEELINSMNSENPASMADIDIKALIMKALRGELNLSLQGVLKGIGKKLFDEILINSKLLAQLIIISVLWGLLNNLTNSFI